MIVKNPIPTLTIGPDAFAALMRQECAALLAQPAPKPAKADAPKSGGAQRR